MHLKMGGRFPADSIHAAANHILQELLWVDASVDFDIGGIGLARRSGKSIVVNAFHSIFLIHTSTHWKGALYPTADGTSWATHFLDGTSELKLGAHGGLLEVRHTGMGFLYVKVLLSTSVCLNAIFSFKSK